MERAEVERLVATIPHWYHQIELAPGVVTPGGHDSPAGLLQLPLPERLDGLRVLDVGARDGFYAFECERRGAEVLAIDYAPADRTGFDVARQVLGSRVGFQQMNVYDVSPERLGRFDVVLCLGLLYHLRDPLLALDRLRDVCTGAIIVETHAIDESVLMPDGSFAPLAAVAPALAEVPLMQFFPGRSLAGDPSNYWAPNAPCLRALLEAACFDVEHLAVHGTRAVASGRVSEDPERVAQRRIEKSTLDEP